MPSTLLCLHKLGLDIVFHSINSIHPKICFTKEEEHNGEIAFLDLKISRKVQKFNFEIYRKPTQTQRTIPVTSNHSWSHKIAAFNSWIHRLFTLPLSEKGFNREKSYILETARKNGYKQSEILRIMNRKKTQLEKEQLSSLFEENRRFEKIKGNGVPYHTLTWM